MKLDGCNALITGASAGIGRELALQLARRAGAITLVARRRERLEELRNQLLRNHADLKVHIREVNLSDPQQMKELVCWLEDKRSPIDFLVNNAGLGDVGDFATSDPGRVQEMIEVNVRSLTLLTRALLPTMIARRRGAILNVSSSASFLPMSGFAVYAATKAYVTSFTEALRGELRGTGVTACSLCPGPVHTEFNAVAARGEDAESAVAPEFLHVDVARVARAGLAAVAHDRALVIPGLAMKAGMAVVRLSPLWLLRFTSKRHAKRS
ncbi:MAG: SDR family NAD(P)-dependent oxidoreductase [Chthoniobacterales bacterium]